MKTTKQDSTRKNDLFTLIACTHKFYLSDFSYSKLPECFNKVFIFHLAEGEHYINNKKHFITNYSIHFVRQGATSKMELGKWVSKITLLAFDNDFLEHNGVHIPFLRELYFFLNDDRSPVLHLQKHFFENVERLLLQIQKENSKKKRPENFHLITLLQNFILSIKKWNDETIAEEVLHITNSDIPLFLKKFILISYEHWKTHKRPCDYAKDLGVTGNHLNRQFHIHFGKTVHIFLDDKIIQKAKELLKDNGMSVKQIAYELNFKSDSYFNHFFKKHTGISANEYRQVV